MRGSVWKNPAPPADHIAAAITSHTLLMSPELRDADGPVDAARVLVRLLRRPDHDTLRRLLRKGTVRPNGLSLEMNTTFLASDLGLGADDLAPG